MRTPLMLAASIGSLTLVKLFIEVYHCDDSLIAPDGQLALRLAAENGHREVVDYLPIRRGGGWRRWKTHHATMVRRIKKAVHRIYKFFKFFLWDIEKFFFWSVPKHVIVLPLKRTCKWAWKNRAKFGPWVKRTVGQIPVKIWKGMKEIPRHVWHFITKTVPALLKEIYTWTKSLFTERIPKAMRIIGRWVWSVVKTSGIFLWDVVCKIASFMHSVVVAFTTFFRNVTLKDLWKGFVSILRTVFIQLPKTVWSSLVSFGAATYKVLKSLFGWVGQCIWYMFRGLGEVVIYLPVAIWVILKSIGSSTTKGFHEFRVWLNPKTA
jgi:Ankyrin repeats (3 copies)